MPSHRNTRQKELVLDALKKSTTHTTADELLDFMKSSGEVVGRATVYRYLKELEDSGKVRKYSLGEKVCSCYQLIEGKDCTSHYHLICEDCGKLEHVDSEIIRRFRDSAKEDYGFEIDDSKTVFYGKCRQCTQEKKKGI